MGFSREVAKWLQKSARDVREAKARFNTSCDMCCSDPKCLWQSSCERCEVAAAHKKRVAELKDIERGIKMLDAVLTPEILASIKDYTDTINADC